MCTTYIHWTEFPKAVFVSVSVSVSVSVRACVHACVCARARARACPKPFGQPHHACALQDVSRLLDICRQSIFFHSITDIAACLAVISNDPDVVLARIKNRYDPDSDGSL